jgi:hypothetical protein
MPHRVLRYRDVPVLWRANPGALRAYVIITSATAAEGLTLVFTSSARTSSEAYRTIHELGGPEVFGAALLGVVTLLITSPLWSLRLTHASLITGSAMHVAMATSFIASAVRSPTTGTLGPIIMTTIALWFVSQAVLYHAARPK